jgi:hypothetical protein
MQWHTQQQGFDSGYSSAGEVWVRGGGVCIRGGGWQRARVAPCLVCCGAQQTGRQAGSLLLLSVRSQLPAL